MTEIKKILDNIEIRLDLSDMISRIGDVGIAIHRHSSRYCVYDEAEVIKMLKKEVQLFALRL